MRDQYRQIIEALADKKRVLITTHARPDGDALGTTAALHLGLKKLGIDSEVLLLTHLPTKYSFIFNDYGVPHHDAEQAWPEGLRLESFDALIVADTGTWSQLPGLKERVDQIKGPKLVIDHHLTQQDWADHKLVVTEAAAAAEVAAELLEQWEIPIDRDIATVLYVGLVSDTGWFQFSSTRPYTMRLAAILMEAGVDTDRLYQQLYQNERAERVALQTHALTTLQLLADGKVAVMRLGKEDFMSTRGSVTDTENLINIPLQIRTVETSILLTEPPEGPPVRVSFRSKGKVDVAKFAEQFGGGGHARASGAKFNCSLDEAAAKVIAAMTAAITG